MTKAEEKLLRAVWEFLKEKGWNVLVASVERIQGPVDARKLNYELVIKFTGAKPEELRE